MLDTEQSPNDQGVAVIRGTGTQRPLFLIHDIHGQIPAGAALLQDIDPDMPIFGLLGVTPHEQLPHSIEALARRCILLLRALQPEGPYRLAGLSFGGILAHEMAAQLIGMDQPIEFLGSIESVEEPLLSCCGENAEQKRHQNARLSAHKHALQHYSMYPLPIPMHVCRNGRALGDSIREATSSSSPRMTLFETSYCPYVSIQPGRRRRAPIFCVPGAGNGVTDFNAWARAVGQEWPVHGLQPRGVAADLGLLPMRSKPDMLKGVVRTFGAALRTTYSPSLYPGPMRLVTVRDTRQEASADARRREKQVEDWRRWAPRLSSWYGPGNHMTSLDDPHVAIVADWWLSDSVPP
jgi:thioesterase domain-containing protein